ncbi:hypothetical protein Bcav_3021 [Beutenbergia cavernae DSM 12333]|uniref:Uncharacterized protein n=1 Tax=Beutenbergia cavernae (strain ATCC BAA-8 / DSM 12333 / CCUG 43141 / JCM 11478 / NBRC 16432 / NCIMB 13614 / HKI 0122) TaxID=471853 RepID=C5BZT6_BEUC1|nr:hypothetical protein [Beutenbergia cavernae]ACQ81266.1 hypothetical protein Bcav_3021 [Beutenbergia cavernae DSM 12333]
MPAYRVRLRRYDDAGVARWARTVRAARLEDAVDLACLGAGLRRRDPAHADPLQLVGTWSARRVGPAGRRDRRVGQLVRREPPALVLAALARGGPGPGPLRAARRRRRPRS